MCKLLGIVEIENQQNAETFAKKAIPIITKTDNHGLGIMRLGEKGVHIQRWLEPPTVVRKKPSVALLKYEKALKHQNNEAGSVSRNLYALAVHGRFATCTKSLENTHPFYKQGTALMHNGIISNAEEFTRELSTCDSEALLSQYVENDVKGDNSRLTNALKGMSGYYAAIVFNDNGVIDIWRDSTASLFLAHVRNVGVVIATTKEIIIGAARKCGATVTGIDEILPFTAIRWDKGLNPRIGTFEAIKPVTFESIAGAEHWWKDYEEKWNTPTGYDYKPSNRRALDLEEEDEADLRELKRLQGFKEGI